MEEELLPLQLEERQHIKVVNNFKIWHLLVIIPLFFVILALLRVGKNPYFQFAKLGNKVKYPFIELQNQKTEVTDYIHEYNASDFQTDEFIRDLNTEFDFRECPACLRTQKTSNSSSKRDLIFSYAYGNRTKGFVSFVRSVRATGCKATIVFMYEDPFLDSFTQSERDLFRKCGTLFINAGKINRKNFNIMTLRYAFFLEFLEIYKNYFDRIVMTDAQDTYVQLDPFDTFPQKGFWSSTEGNYFWKYKWHRARVVLTEGSKDVAFFNNTRTLCAGLIWGNINDTLDFLRFFVNVSYWKSHPRVNDQGLMNILYYRKNYSFHADFTGRYMISASDFDWEPKYDQHYLFRTVYGTTPSIIHQYDRICVIYANVEYLCPKAPGQPYGFDTGSRFKSNRCPKNYRVY